MSWTRFLLTIILVLGLGFGVGAKDAFVTIHYEGTPNDEDYVLAIRVMFSSIQKVGTEADLVVMTAPSVSQETITLFQSEGIKIVPVDNIENPYKEMDANADKYQKHFEFTLNKLKAWTLTEYDRIVQLDADNVVAHNIDELFLCGHFCALFMHPYLFHTGLFVLKPDMAVYEDMVAKLPSMYSHDGADQGFLNSYFSDMEDAPSFNPDHGKSEAPVQRLPMAYNMNAWYFYESLGWEHYAIGRWRETPYLVLGFPSPKPLKPWNWWPYLMLQEHFVWAAARMDIVETTNNELIMVVVVVGLVHVGLLHLQRGCWSQNPASNPRKNLACRGLHSRWFAILGPYWGGFLAALLTAFLSTFMAASMVPRLTVVYYAIPAFAGIWGVCSYWLLQGYAYAVDNPYLSTTFALRGPLFSQAMVLVACMVPIYTSPATKVFTVLLAVVTWIISFAFYFISSTERPKYYELPGPL
eukprot:Clim_evm168s157 gene=Clim_evmTU168s157